MRCRPAERCDGTQQGEKRRVWKTSQTSGAFYPSCEVHVTALRKLLMTFENLNPFVRCSAGPPDGFRRAYLLSCLLAWGTSAQPSTGRQQSVRRNRDIAWRCTPGARQPPSTTHNLVPRRHPSAPQGARLMLVALCARAPHARPALATAPSSFITAPRPQGVGGCVGSCPN